MLMMLLAGCSADRSSTSVIPEAVDISPDRRTVEVRTGYPATLNCGKDPGGLDVEVADDVVTVVALMAETGADRCTLECEAVTQAVTLAEPLPEDVRFEAAPNAEPGCSGMSALFVDDSVPPADNCGPPSAASTEFDRSMIPMPGPVAGASRTEFGEQVIRTLTPMVVGADAGTTVAELRAAGWYVTVGDRSQSSATATPDMLWSRLTVTTCAGLIDEISFD